VTFQEIFTARMFLNQASKHLAHAHIRYDPEGRHFWSSADSAEAFAILETSLCELEREFEAKRSRRKRSAAKAA
jgi:hypothetical protein